MNGPANKSEIALAKELKVFFNRGEHDLKNFFHSARLWIDNDRESNRAETVHLLHELETYYTSKMNELRRSFDTLLAIRTETASAASINVATLMTEVLGELEKREGKARIVTSLDAKATLFCSEEHLRGGLYALIDNAWRYQDPQRTLTVTTTVYPTEKGVCVSIQDNGMGIDTLRYREQLFTPFVRYTDRSEGQGISLYLVKAMVEKNGGHVALVSEPGRGTTVTLHLVHQS